MTETFADRTKWVVKELEKANIVNYSENGEAKQLEINIGNIQFTLVSLGDRIAWNIRIVPPE